MDVSGIELCFVLHDVLYIYNWNEANLLSWRKLDLLGEFYLLGQDGTLEVKLKKDHSTILRSTFGVHVYTLEFQISKGQVYVSAVQFWHEAIGHSSPKSWTKSSELYSDLHILPKSSSNFYCHKCATMNMKCHVPSSVNSLSKYPYDLVYADLSGPISPQSIGGALYTLALLDDCTHFGEIFFLKHKSDAIKYIKTFCKKIFNQTGKYPRIFHTDGGGEFVNNEINSYCSNKGITHRTTAAYQHESNGALERYNQTLQHMVRPSLTDLPKFLWAECYNWAVYIRNRLPHSALKGRTPFEVMFDKKPTIKHLRPFGAHCLVQIPVEKRGAGSKLSPRVLEGRFVGYTGTTHMFRVYIPSQRKVDTYRQVQLIPSNDTTSLAVYLPSDVTLTHATPTATSQTPPLPSTPNIPNQPSTPPHGRMPGTFSPEPTPR